MCSCQQHGASAETKVEGITFRVADMTCNHCASTIRKAIETSLPGAAIAIDLGKHEVTVAGDAGLAEQAIRTAGYEPLRLN
jgi:copper chaperone